MISFLTQMGSNPCLLLPSADKLPSQGPGIQQAAPSCQSHPFNCYLRVFAGGLEAIGKHPLYSGVLFYVPPPTQSYTLIVD
ncbi:hypothetical protein DSO57_1007750 [Entomophthora muscae]|uniref:Uncharacterized protein n=1 Tax=Entomophthora muscae TaxID=34485 RepID=A0ACC2UH72_9FUNG|nr:hypothetical protein DSO57_1007750 [Entomophthora muscae]